MAERGAGDAPRGAHADADADTGTAIETASIIRLLRVFVGATEPPPSRDSGEATSDGTPRMPVVSAEEAGELLWDMSASRAVARLMLRYAVLDALELILTRELLAASTASAAEAAPDEQGGASSGGGGGGPDLRLLELALGIAANLAAHPDGAAALAARPDLVVVLLLTPSPPPATGDGGDGAAGGSAAGGGGVGGGGVGGALGVDDARVLGELCRLGSTCLRSQAAPAWLARVVAPPLLSRLLWVAASTLDATLLARVLDLLAAILRASAEAEAAGAAEAAEAEAQPLPRTAEDAAGEARKGPAAAAASGVGQAGTASAAAVSGALLRLGLPELLHAVLAAAAAEAAPRPQGDDPWAEGGGGGEGDPMLYGDDYDNSVRQCAGSNTPPPRPGGYPCRAAQEPAGAGASEAEGAGEGATAEAIAPEAEAAADETAAGAAAAVAAAVACGVPLSDGATDAALRLVEELAGGEGGGEALLEVLAARRLSPGLLELLLRLLRHADSAQGVEGAAIALADLGRPLCAHLAAAPPAEAAALAARAAEVLRDSGGAAVGGCGGDAAEGSVALAAAQQLQVACWFLLAAGLRAAAAASGEGDAAFAHAAQANEQGRREHAECGEEGGEAQLRGGLWEAVAGAAAALPGLPRPAGCEGYARAGCAAAITLAEAALSGAAHVGGRDAGAAAQLGEEAREDLSFGGWDSPPRRPPLRVLLPGLRRMAAELAC